MALPRGMPPGIQMWLTSAGIALWIWTAAAASMAAASVAAASMAAEDPFESCWSKKGARRAACVYREAQSANLWQDAARQLRALHQNEPEDDHLVDALGRIALATGDAQATVDYSAAAAAAFAAEGDVFYEIYARLNLNEGLRLLGHLDEAKIEVETASRLAEELGRGVAVFDTRLASLRLSRHRGEDLESLRRSLLELEQEMTQEHGLDYPIMRLWFYDFGEVLRGLHRLDEALALNLRWAELARLHKQTYDQATATINAATTVSQMAWRTGARAETRRLAESALGLALEVGQPYAEGEALRLLGLIEPGEAGRSLLRRCLLKTRLGSTSHVKCHMALAASLASDVPLVNPEPGVVAEAVDLAAAEAVFAEALSEVAESEDPWAAILPWNERFQALWATRSREQALDESLRVLDLIESLRGLQRSQDGRADFFAAWVGAYHALVGRLLGRPGGPSTQDVDAAFRISERMRARVLLDDLATADREPGILGSSALDSPAASSGEELHLSEERTEILQTIVEHQRRLQSPSLEADLRQMTLRSLESAEADLADLDAKDPMLMEWAHELAELSDIQEALASHEALFVFQLAPDEDVFGLPAGGSWLLVITPMERQLHRLPSGPEIEAKVAMLLGLVESDSGAGTGGSQTFEGDFGALVETAAAALYEDLLADAVDALPPDVERWIVAPDGVLHLLPFSLLAPDARLSTVPSPTFWLRWQEEPGAPAVALAFADPADFASTDGDVVATRRGEMTEGLQLGRLPHARHEGQSLVDRLGPPSRLLLDTDASEFALQTLNLGGYGVLHFAAHAVLDAERPHRSALLLSPGSEHHDGLLQPREIAELDLEGKLVVLSACQSAHGEAQLGEGVESLARAFFRAGARAVVASRWRLRDDDAAAFFDAFYDRLVQGVSVDSAVMEARASRRRAGATTGAWAGVVVIGDGAWVPVAGGVGHPWHWLWIVGLSSGLVLAVAAIVALRLKSEGVSH